MHIHSFYKNKNKNDPLHETILNEWKKLQNILKKLSDWGGVDISYEYCDQIEALVSNVTC